MLKSWDAVNQPQVGCVTVVWWLLYAFVGVVAARACQPTPFSKSNVQMDVCFDQLELTRTYAVDACERTGWTGSVARVHGRAPHCTTYGVCVFSMNFSMAIFGCCEAVKVR